MRRSWAVLAGWYVLATVVLIARWPAEAEPDHCNGLDIGCARTGSGFAFLAGALAFVGLLVSVAALLFTRRRIGSAVLSGSLAALVGWLAVTPVMWPLLAIVSG
jgi:hypothetical protein